MKRISDKLTVLMTTYKEPPIQLRKSIESILNQTFGDFIFIIIVDDPNNKDGIDVIKNYAEKDNRIIYYINEKNIGTAMSMNKGIELTNTEYIARMDADDISLPNRLKTQINYLEEHQEVDLLGTNLVYMDENDNLLFNGEKSILSNDLISKSLKYIDVVYQPTFMGKTSMFKSVKYRDLKNCQDYDFLCRSIENGYKINNLPNYLLHYRIASNKSDRVLLYHSIAPYYIKKYYRKGKLRNTDVKSLIEKDISKANKKRILNGRKRYMKGFELRRQEKYLSATFQFVLSCFYSKYNLDFLYSLVRFYFVNKKALKIENKLAHRKG